MRSLALARSSSRRAPPNAASNPPASSASSRVRVCCRLREAPWAGIGDPAGVDGLLHGTDDQLVTVLAEPAVAELDDFVEVVAGVDVQHGKRQR